MNGKATHAPSQLLLGLLLTIKDGFAPRRQKAVDKRRVLRRCFGAEWNWIKISMMRRQVDPICWISLASAEFPAHPCVHLTNLQPCTNKELPVMCKLLNSFPWDAARNEAIDCTLGICISKTWKKFAGTADTRKRKKRIYCFRKKRPRPEWKAIRPMMVRKKANSERQTTYLVHRTKHPQSALLSFLLGDPSQDEIRSEGKIFFMDCLPDLLL